MMRRLVTWRRKPAFFEAEDIGSPHYAGALLRFASGTRSMADFDGSLSQINVSSSARMPIMKHPWLGIGGTLLVAGTLCPTSLIARSERGPAPATAPDGPYARIAFLRPHDGGTVDFEAGYIRHLEFHRQAKDTWVWYGWTIWAGERQRWFVYATFGHSAASLDSPVTPAEDERDNVANVTPHAQFAGNAVYEYLPALSRGSGVPQPAPRLELTTVDLHPARREPSRRRSARRGHPAGRDALVSDGRQAAPLRATCGCVPGPSLSAILGDKVEPSLPDTVSALIAKTTVEILSLRPTMSYGLSPARQ